MINKHFLYNGEEYVVDELILQGNKCICKNYDTDEYFEFYTDFVEKQIKTYKEDLKLEKLSKEKKDDEQEILKKIIMDYFFTKTIDK